MELQFSVLKQLNLPDKPLINLITLFWIKITLSKPTFWLTMKTSSTRVMSFWPPKTCLKKLTLITLGIAIMVGFQWLQRANWILSARQFPLVLVRPSGSQLSACVPWISSPIAEQFLKNILEWIGVLFGEHQWKRRKFLK